MIGLDFFFYLNHWMHGIMSHISKHHPVHVPTKTPLSLYDQWISSLIKSEYSAHRNGISID